jgi:hypothetical protein
MGTLKVRYPSGQWSAILGSGFDAANTAKWNSAWGLVGETRWGSSWTNATSSSTVITASSGSNTFAANLYANRRYRLYWQGMVTSTAAGDYVVLQHQINGTPLGENNAQYISAANAQYFTWLESRYTPPADGSYTFVVIGRRGSSSTGTVSVINTGNNPLWLMIEDLGPITPATTAPPTSPSVTTDGNSLGIVAMGSYINTASTPVPLSAGVDTKLTNPVSAFMAVGRRYRIGVRIRAILGVAGANVSFWLYKDGASNRNGPGGDPYVYIGGAYHSFSYDYIYDGDGLTHSFELVANASAAFTGTNQGVYTNLAEYYLEDVGPNTYPALPIPATPPAWTPLTLSGSWTNYGGGWAPAAYRKMGDKVEIRGLIANTVLQSQIGFLPVGFRPPYHQMWDTWLAFPTNQRAAVRMNIQANDGQLILQDTFAYPTGTTLTLPPTAVTNLDIAVSYSTTA